MSRKFFAAVTIMVAALGLLVSAPVGAQSADTYRVTFTNTSAGQPMTPPVVGIHDASAVHLFQVGQPAIPQVQAIAEGGDNGPLVALVGTLDPAVLSAAGVAVPDPAGPVLPGQSVSIDLTSSAAGHSLSLVAMVVCTNDGITGLDSVALPTAGLTSTFALAVYDAGTEVNDLDPDYWVPPCGGDGSNMHTDENGVIAAHPGQTGVGGFDFAGGVSLATVTVENLSAAPAPAPAPAPAHDAAPAAPTATVPQGATSGASDGCPTNTTCGLGFGSEPTISAAAPQPVELALTGAETSVFAMVGLLAIALGAALLAMTSRPGRD